MNNIDEHIQKDQSEIEAARAAGDMAKVRHLEEELQGLKEYKEHHPEDSHDPSPLEVYCDLNPAAPECRVGRREGGGRGAGPRLQTATRSGP